MITHKDESHLGNNHGAATEIVKLFRACIVPSKFNVALLLMVSKKSIGEFALKSS
jgi:hypothetical protein